MMKFRSAPLLRKFIFSYLLIFTLLMIFGVIGYVRSINILEQEARNQSTASLERTQQMIDSAMMEIDRLVDEFSLNARITNYVYSTPEMGSSFYDKMRLALKEIDTLSFSNSYIYDMYIYHHASNQILNSSGVYDLEHAFRLVTPYTDLSLDEWYRMISKEYRFATFYPEQVLASNSKSTRILCLVSPLPSYAINRNDVCNLVVMIDLQQLSAVINASHDVDSGEVMVFDESGDLLFSANNHVPVDPESCSQFPDGYSEVIHNGMRLSVSSITSSQSGWRYISALPTAELMQHVNNTRNMTLYFIGSTALLGVLLIFALSRYNYRPIYDAASRIQNATGPQRSVVPAGDELRYIENIARKSIQENQDMQHLLEEYKPVLRTDVILQLLHGEVTVGSDTSDTLNAVGIEFPASHFCVILIQAEDVQAEETAKERTLRKFTIKNVCERAFSGCGTLYIASTDMRTMSVIVNLPTEESYPSESLMSAVLLVKDMLKNSAWFPRLGIGGLYEGIRGIYQSYLEARRALEYCRFHPTHTHYFFSEIHPMTSFYYFTMEAEQLLLESIKQGNRAAMEQQLKEISEAIEADTPASAEVARCVCFDLMGTALKLIGSLNVEISTVFGQVNPVEKLSACQSIQEMQKSIQWVFHVLCDHFSKAQNNRGDQLCQRIISYIEGNYSDPNLSLTQTAEVIGITPSYLSHYLKQQISDNFLSILRSIRIQKAEALLASTQMTLDEIAHAVGYANAAALTYNFKKLHTMAPGQFREFHQADGGAQTFAD